MMALYEATCQTCHLAKPPVPQNNNQTFFIIKATQASKTFLFRGTTQSRLPLGQNFFRYISFDIVLRLTA